MSKRILAWLTLATLIALPAAVAQDAGMVRVLDVHVQLGHQQHYESLIPQLWDAFKKGGVSFPVFVSAGVSDVGTYTFVVPFNSFADLDAQEQAVSKAFAGAPGVMGELQAISTGQDQSIWAMRPELTYTPETPRLAMEEQRFTRIALLYPHPAKAQEFETVLKEAAEVRKKHGIADGTTVAQLVIGTDAPAYAVLIGAKDEADFHAQAAKSNEKMGADWQAIVAKGGPMLRKIEYSSMVERPDLNYQP